MNTVYSILVSDGVVALHFLLTMVLLAVVILRGIHSDMKLRRVAAENSDLRRQLTELSDITSSSIHELRRNTNRQRDAVCHTADYLSGAAALDLTWFNALYDEPRRDDAFPGSELLSVDLVCDPAEPDLSLADSAFVEPGPDYLEPDVSMPLKASMITMPGNLDDAFDEGAGGTIRSGSSDILTRVLQQSRGN